MPPNVEVRRSARRRRTVSAYRDGDKTVVMLPSRLSQAEEEKWVATLLQRLAERERRRRPSDDALLDRARELSRRYLDAAADPVSVRWVTNQRTRWGSCTPDDGTIRLSSRLRGMPAWVVDYVLVHELAHLLVPGHGPDFWDLVGRYPRTERARGYLEGIVAAEHLPVEGDSSPEDGDHPDHPGHSGHSGDADLPQPPGRAGGVERTERTDDPGGPEALEPADPLADRSREAAADVRGQSGEVREQTADQRAGRPARSKTRPRPKTKAKAPTGAGAGK